MERCKLQGLERVGGRSLREYWMPAAELVAFNAATVGAIEVVSEFRRGFNIVANSDSDHREPIWPYGLRTARDRAAFAKSIS